MQTSDRGLLALIRHEGVVPGPYLDVKDIWTVGIGHTAAAGLPDPARMPRGMPGDLDAGIREAFRIFRTDLAAGDRVAAAAAFMGWLKPAAIRSRREAERDLFAKGRYPTGTIPVWSVDRNGRVDFSRPIRRLTEVEALALLRPTGTTMPPPAQSTTAPSWWQRLTNLFTRKETT